MELLIGAGSNRDKRLWQNNELEWKELVTLDNNADHNPDVVHDLESFPLPFEDNKFDEVHAYAVLEHTGSQGDWKFFFDQFAEFHRILKPDGIFFAMVPSSCLIINKADLDGAKDFYVCPGNIIQWGDPSHKRMINAQTLSFLSQKQYQEQVGKTMMSDFRFYYKADFEAVYIKDDGQLLYFALKAIKDVPGWTSNNMSKE